MRIGKLVVLLWVSASAAVTQAAPRMNVLWILTDDARPKSAPGRVGQDRRSGRRRREARRLQDDRPDDRLPGKVQGQRRTLLPHLRPAQTPQPPYRTAEVL